MPSITYRSQAFEALPGETVLQSLRREGHDVPSSCEAGACQSCLLQAIEGTPPTAAQQGLKEPQRRQGYFLSCLARPESDLEVVLPGEAAQIPATVTGLERLSEDVLALRLVTASPFAYQAGQFLNLIREDGLIRPYSIASLPGRDGFLELHVRRTPDGSMSSWIHDSLRIGDRVHVRGPAGDCCYVPGEPQAPLLLVGTGTGLAPLYAVTQDALRHEHRGPMVLIHGSLHEDGFYLVDRLLELAAAHPNLGYTRCMPEGSPRPGVEIGTIEAIAQRHAVRPADWRVYLCGNPTLVHALRKKLFLAGASLQRIHSDAFITAPRKG